MEGSAAVLLGVSRAYKESSNCRMEAQYALQKKKPLVPLMLVEGYEADGWLGLMLGTSMWYALYGSTLTSDGAFEDRMDALCRELGDWGRADSVASGEQEAEVNVEPEPEPHSAGADALVELVQELEELKLLALSRRALSMGAVAESVDEAMDADDGRSALIALIVSIESSRGPAERMVSALEGGGEASADIVIGVLDHTISVLEHVSVSCARKSRKVVRALLERTEATSEAVSYTHLTLPTKRIV